MFSTGLEPPHITAGFRWSQMGSNRFSGPFRIPERSAKTDKFSWPLDKRPRRWYPTGKTTVQLKGSKMTDWYRIALEAAIHEHNPERYEGRSWQELDLVEQEAAITVAADKLFPVEV